MGQFVPQQTISIKEDPLLMNQFFSKASNALPYIGRSVLMKSIDAQSYWNFKLGVEKGSTLPPCIVIGL